MVQHAESKLTRACGLLVLDKVGEPITPRHHSLDEMGIDYVFLVEPGLADIENVGSWDSCLLAGVLGQCHDIGETGFGRK